MPTERAAAQLLAELIETRMERDRFGLDSELLRGQLLRHASGALQLREVARGVKGLVERCVGRRLSARAQPAP